MNLFFRSGCETAPAIRPALSIDASERNEIGHHLGDTRHQEDVSANNRRLLQLDNSNHPIARRLWVPPVF